MADLKSEINKRRTFAIISHPDAGKTTLTEKFLLLQVPLREKRQPSTPYPTGWRLRSSVVFP